MKTKLLILSLLATTACQASSYIRPPYTLGQERCEKVVLSGENMAISVCELSVGFERTCYILQKDLRAYMATPCKFYDEVVRAPKIVR